MKQQAVIKMVCFLVNGRRQVFILNKITSPILSTYPTMVKYIFYIINFLCYKLRLVPGMWEVLNCLHTLRYY